MSPRPSVLLVTSAMFASGEIGGDLVAALDRTGVAARWVVWDDDAVDWTADLVAVRSTWDYHRRCPDFLTWARSPCSASRAFICSASSLERNEPVCRK